MNTIFLMSYFRNYILKWYKQERQNTFLVFNYCKHDNFHMGIIFTFFTTLSSLWKFPPLEIYANMTLLRELHCYIENFLHVKGFFNNFAKFTQRKITTFTASDISEYAEWHFESRYGGVEVAGWTVDRTIQVGFRGYPHCMWAHWWLGGERRFWTSRCLCQGRLRMLKTPSCPWSWVPGSRSKFGIWATVPSLYSRNITECDVKPQPANQHFESDSCSVNRKRVTINM